MIYQNLTHLYNELLAFASSNICVFDLDSTLFNVSPRSEKILHEFGILNNIPKLLNVTVDKKDWGVYEALLRSGIIQSLDESLLLKLKEFWKEKFFTNEYLQYDTPYSGAIHFVQSLAKKNIEIHYLTGRDIFRMEKGTSSVLKKWGLPYDAKQIHLKPQKELDDHLFKLSWIKKISEEKKDFKIFLFENEPVNINLIANQLPKIRLIYMNTTHSRKENITGLVTEIFDYTIERD